MAGWFGGAHVDVLDRLGRIGVVPVIEISDAAKAGALGRALAAGGLPCAEITFRTSTAAAAIRAIRDECPEVLVGAGTVLTIDQADQAVAAGARFLVAPGLNPAVVRHALDRGLPMLPGVCTPTEIEAAMGLGLGTLKFFPAEVAGGVAYLRAVCAPYRSIRFVPTGGIGPANLASYLALPQVLACGGSWMVPRDLLDAGDFEAITSLAAEAVALVRAARSAVV
jgi:2-dehydro-3-deoxyphosphogluconate aldolase/(4S)-4-hydroxy-2-oxoglutarate aldolase